MGILVFAKCIQGSVPLIENSVWIIRIKQAPRKKQANSNAQ